MVTCRELFVGWLLVEKQRGSMMNARTRSSLLVQEVGVVGPAKRAGELHEDIGLGESCCMEQRRKHH